MKRLICSALFTLAASAPAWSQGWLDADTMQHFGGTCMIECGSNASAKATVLADAVVLLQGDKRMDGARPGFQTVLMSEAPGGQMLFAIYQDKTGYDLQLDGDAKVMAAAAAAPQKKYELHELDANLVLLSPRVRPIYFKALGPLAREHWLAKLDGPAPQNRRTRVAGVDFVQMSTCKNHDCADNNAVFLYSVEQNVLYGTVYQKGRTTLIGAPPPAVAAELPKLWRQEWRRK